MRQSGVYVVTRLRLPAALSVALVVLSGCGSTQTKVEPTFDTSTTVAASSRSTRVLDTNPSTQSAEGFEDASSLYAADLLTPGLLNGPHHRLQPEVGMARGMALYKIDTEYGVQEALGIETLETRITELDVLAELDRMSRIGTFAGAARDSAVNTARAVGTVFSHPEETARALPEALKREASGLFAKAKIGAKNIADDVGAYFRGTTEQNTDNPFLPPVLIPVEPVTAEEKTQARNARARDVSGDLALDYIGYSSARRELSKKLGVNPYTSNPLVHERLDGLSWAAWGGSKSTGMAIGAMAGGANFILSRSRKLNDLVWDLDPEALEMRNRRVLGENGYDDRLSRRFMRNNAFNPGLQTSFVDAFVALRGIGGHDRLLRWARYAEDAVEARYIVTTLDMALAQGGLQRFESVQMHQRNALFKTYGGELVTFLPVDYLAWTPATASYFEGFPRQLTVYSMGPQSPRFAEVCSSYGWTCAGRALPGFSDSFARPDEQW